MFSEHLDPTIHWPGDWEDIRATYLCDPNDGKDNVATRCGDGDGKYGDGSGDSSAWGHMIEFDPGWGICLMHVGGVYYVF